MRQVVSTCLAGAAVGSISGAGLAEKFGRKGTLVLDTIPLLLGAFAMATATSLNGLIAGRVLVGIGIGLASAIVPLYISEVLRAANAQERNAEHSMCCAASTFARSTNPMSAIARCTVQES
jgi:MFS family permease